MTAGCQEPQMPGIDTSENDTFSGGLHCHSQHGAIAPQAYQHIGQYF